MTSDGTRCFEYDDANQLKKVKSCANNQTIAEYLYDHSGKRLVKKEYENGTLKHTIYSPTDEYETKKLPNGTTENITYFKVNDEVVAKKNPDGSYTYFHNDHLGSSSVLTNQSGQVVEKTSYEPYGEVKTGGTNSKWGYTGQEKDLETGLNYYDARYYDPHIHRFTQPDTLLPDIYDPQLLNRYAYVRNNPLKYTDPSGNILQLIPRIIPFAQSAGNFLYTKAAQLLQSSQSVVTKIAANPTVNKFIQNIGKSQSNPVVNRVENNATKILNNSTTKQTAAPLRGTQNPAIQKAVEFGKQMHKTQQYPQGYNKEVGLESGKRVDALNKEIKHIIELKPDTPEAIRKGQKQLEGYIDELNITAEGGWTGEVWTYPKPGGN